MSDGTDWSWLGNSGSSSSPIDWSTYDWTNLPDVSGSAQNAIGTGTSLAPTSSTDWSWLTKLGGSALSALGTQGGGAALGGLLGYLGAKNTPSSTTTTTEPWLAQQPYLMDAFNGAASAAKGNSQTDKANANYSSVLNGPTVNPMLGQNNPYLQTAIDNANADVNRSMMPAMNAANKASGSYGNSGVAQTYGKALTDAYSQNANNMRMTDYTNQQNLQQQNVNNTLGFTTNANSWAAQPSQNYASTVRGNYGQSSTTPLYSNTASGLLGGAVTGYKLAGG